MNHANHGGASQSRAYSSVQNALQPVGDTLQVDESLSSLNEALEFHTETVHALLRRLEPATGELGATPDNCLTGIAKVPLALRIDVQRDQVVLLTALLQTAIRQLQI